MPITQPNLWNSGDAYERYMGRWSRKVAPIFTEWIAALPESSWIDVGCGTGALTSAILSACEPARVVAVDSSDAILTTAEVALADTRVHCRLGDAASISEPDGRFDVAVAGLLLNFVSDKEAILREMARVTRPGGTVALYVWDYAGHMQLMRTFFDAAIALDPSASAFDDGMKAPICRPEPLKSLLTQAGLRDVEVRAIDIPTPFDSFDDYWTPFLGGTGSAPRYCMSLSEEARERLREDVRGRLRTGPDGEILLAARAWAVKGTVAEGPGVYFTSAS
ncbi:class I SAM-dependent methyltransferase [Microvirga pudoricolor]|uniref:class I SAM-dependent methyltransferase n=1 Tax=Microvirga pudoricolor TaxID=2778729 RepID=UPI00194DCE0A|nr:class I SAM-dependent methyltransferase [Microvirga pudoricolor]MBM6596432.1 methyltransferase domain-containing protein [Microvirga pudoricolor]